MKIGLYAGSFDPWSIGHQYVLDSALVVFDAIHVVVAVHPSKQSRLDANTRARLVAHAVDPWIDWWNQKSPFTPKKEIVVNTHEGLVADYAKAHNITHLIRGLRSTSDFEAEFNLYFANQAIHSSLQTWAIMCPPRLLHCSSTYIRAVTGNPNVRFVGTSFVAQAVMLDHPRLIGWLYDLFYTAELKEMSKTNQDIKKFTEKIQFEFSTLLQKKITIDPNLLKRIYQKLKLYIKETEYPGDCKVYRDLLHALKLN